ncbi:hypothetical protein BCR44DRAFT_1514332 [Catenaria anguillulae PL171]|uniref:Nucleolar protein 12 n=1 Tax=Catenaria anguillulae PL171 TaxID=765915 RepID=A0A1Y2HGZ3_9FUNG|nr:hypothetical protein BCR44DRAFT_1514332 [Catenaria anguillulae PL171]
MSFVNDLFKSATVDKELDSLFAKSKGPATKPAALTATPIAVPTTARTNQNKPAPKTASAQAPSKAKATNLAKPQKRAAPESDSESDEESDAESDSDDAESDSDDDQEDASGSGSDAAEEADSDAEADGVAPAADSAAAPKKPQSEKQAEREKLQRTVFVGNVTIRASEKEIYKEFRAKFAEHGHVESIRFRSITFTDALPRKLNFKLKNFHPERDSCNAYVVFSTAEAAKKAAAAINASTFEGKHLRCDYLGKTDGSEGRVGARRDVKRCVFVGNVPFDIEDEALWTFFAQAGEVESVRVIRDKKVGLGKGFAYVQFKERSTVPLALKLHETDFKGKPIRVFKCHKLDDNNTTSSAKSSSAKPAKKGSSSGKSDDKQPPKKKAKTAANEPNSLASSSALKKRKTRARTSEWKKGHEQKKRKAAKELPRKLAKKAKKLATQPGKK